jgi:methylmalonyl-CoA mutase
VLRATLAAAGAVTGGATSFAVLPYDATGTTSADSIRLARNTQLVLGEEAQIGRVADPAAGSGAVEAMTGALAAKAWERFRSIEAEGGIVAAIRGKRLLNTLSERRSLRRGRAASGEIALIGVNANVAAGARINARATELPDGVLAFERLDSGFVADDPK